MDTEKAETAAPAEGENPRNHPAFEAIKTQLNAEREAAAKLKAELDAIRSSDAERAAEAERKKLEAAGEYEKIVATLRAEREAESAKYAAEITKRDLQFALTRAGLGNDLALAGAVASYAGGDLAEYVEQVKEKHPELFAAPGMVPAAHPAQGASARGGAPPTTDLKSRALAGDLSAMKEAARLAFEGKLK
jgi:hypothetical protein